MLSIRFTRFINNYGPYQFPEKLIPKTIIRVSLGLKIPIYGTGKNIRNWIYVEDHYRAVESVLMSGKRERYTTSPRGRRKIIRRSSGQYLIALVKIKMTASWSM